MDGKRPDRRDIQALSADILGGGIAVEPITTGISTYVYRVTRQKEVFYLRVLPEAGATFAPEVHAHLILHRRGVRVPEVVYWEDLNERVGRSVMVTTEIAGRALDHDERVGAVEIVRAAGRDLALINRVPVDGFSWIRREVPADVRLRGEMTTERDFMLAKLETSLDVLTETVLDEDAVGRIRDAVVAHDHLLDATQASLAHGDFDATHIFCHQERYTGIIDFGEIRGTGPDYDLGHFHFHDREHVTVALLPPLLQGYAEVSPLPLDAERRIAFNSLLIGLEFLARTHRRLARHNRRHAIASIGRDLSTLTR